MKEILQYLNNNPHVFYLAFGAVAASNIVFFYLGGKKAESMFNGVDASKAMFRERGASGYSRKSIATRFGGASRVLDVIVTDTELCIKGIYSPFTYIGTKYNLTRRVALADIKAVEQNGNEVEVEFLSDHNVVLLLKDVSGFIKAVKG